ncbi:MAG TPA: L-threonylcarbamoyladenylate synthase [Gemmatimonadaceae bacterium]|nr:L-threonylcarbamoyladenylate synthase [Gemmatimonadaceae bacterium]
MSIVHVASGTPGPQLLAHAASIIRRGGLVAFPTETVYGLGANALDADAVARIFAAKGRPAFNPLIVHVPGAAQARELTTDWPDAAERLARAFWPGPLTLVLRKRDVVPDIVTAGLDSVGVRVPSHPIALALLRAAERPIAAPSANRYTELSPTTAEHVARSLGDRVELIIDGGPTTVGIESTVVDVTGAVPRLLRPGMLGLDALRAVVGEVAPPPDADAPLPDDAPHRSPGMAARHYAPRARLVLFDPTDRAGAARLAETAAARGERVGALLLAPLDAPLQHPVRMPADPAAYAHRLYAALHGLDAERCDLVLAEQPPDTPAWAAVRDRLRRGATEPASA